MAQSGANRDNTTAFVHPEWNLNGMSPVEGVSNTLYATPLPRLLQDAGYYTIHIGKAHWASAGTPGASPYNMGYLVNVSGNVAGMPRSYYSEENYGNTPEKWNMLAVQNMTGDNGYVKNAVFENIESDTKIHAGYWWGKGEPIVVCGADVNGEIRFCITGERPETCTHDCSTCAGCH